MKIKRLLALVAAVGLSLGTLQAQNMISNGNFESSFTSWQNIVSSSASATFSIGTGTDEVKSGSKAMKVVVTTAGTNAYDIQSIHAGWASVTGTTYELKVWAKASTSGATIKLVQQNTNYAEKSLTLTTSYAEYTWSYTATEDGTKFRLNFPQAGTFYIDSVYIDDPNAASAPATTALTVTPATTYQTMEGFGGAMTWYSNWLMYGSSTTRDELYQYLFSDLGLDILRLKNWYFPTNYPTDKTTTTMTDISSYNATIEFFTKAKAINPDIDVLMCSWTPPTYMKSNSSIYGGTLKKNSSDTFMYSEYAQYWTDLLDAYSASGMNPDFISIQNEPGYVNTGWETCEWRPTETSDYPSYGTAFDSVYNRVKNRTNAPKMIGPEVENIGTDADISANTFTGYTDPIKSKEGLYAYAYHIYNFSGSNEASIMSSATASSLNILKDYTDKQNFMTEFGSLDWFNTALMIQQSVTEANASAYIHWELVWTDDDATAVALTTAGAYTIKPSYYTLKHFAKYIDKGYTRVNVATDNSYVVVSAFKNPSESQVTLVAINRADTATSATFDLGSLNITGIQAFQSVSGSYFQALSGLTSTSAVPLSARSITTIVIDYSDPASNAAPTVSITSPASGTTYAATASITINATASDSDGSIARVDFYNGTTLIGSASSAPYSYTWTNVGIGTYAITAVATDNDDSTATSTPITIVVNANQLPSASFTTSTDTVYLEGSSTYDVSATATDSDGSIATVELYNNATKIATLAGSGTDFSGTITVDPGTYTLTLVATDSNNGQTTSSELVLVVYAKQTLALAAGWNLISIYLTPRYTPIETIFGSTGDSLITIKTADGFYAPSQLDAFNSLTDISGGHAYLVKMKYAATVSIAGMPIANFSSELKQGWNLLGYPFDSTSNISTSLSSISSSIDAVKNFDGFWKPNTTTSSITLFEAGKGYFINVTSDQTLAW